MNLAVPHVVRNWQMQEALGFNFPRLEQHPARDDVLSIVGYGPSILETWREIRGPVLSLSGAHDFLARLGIDPTWHADCDPRIHKSNFVAYPRPATIYLMASCCHPITWQYLLRSRVQLWHADTGPEAQAWLAEHGAGARAVRPGPSIGTAALSLAKLLGFRRARCFGYDSCLVDGERRAGPSDAPYTDELPQVVDVGGLTYLTTENMLRQVEAFSEFADGLEVELVGDGLLKALLDQPKGGLMATKGTTPKKIKKPADELASGARITYVTAEGSKHGGALTVLNADGSAELALDDGTVKRSAPRSKKAGERGAWSPA